MNFLRSNISSLVFRSSPLLIGPFRNFIQTRASSSASRFRIPKTIKPYKDPLKFRKVDHKLNDKSNKEITNEKVTPTRDSEQHAVVSTFDLFSIGIGPSSR